MDWIEELIEKVKKYLKSVSLKKAMVIYIICAMICVFLLWVITCYLCNGWQTLVLSKHNINYRDVIAFEALDIDLKDKRILKLVYFIRNYSVFLYSMAAIIIVSNLYYNDKLREPLNILKVEADYVKRGDLNFECKYESLDEMGDICKTFNDMRLKLIENNKAMWSLIEEQSNLNAVMAHDLRNPLCIIEGYNEMLIKYLPEGKIDEEKLFKTLKLTNKQILRMKEFLDKVKSIRSFSEMRATKKKGSIKDILDSINEMIKLSHGKDKIKIAIVNEVEIKECFYDLAIIEETVGNIISNAVRFAEKEIIITIKFEEDKLYIYVQDDGRGFTKKELYKAVEPFYTSENNESSHFGIGLNVCKILTEKHGGSITITNSIDGGAIVCADFFVM